MRETMENEYANVHRGLHYLSNAATQAFEDAREKARAFLNAPTADQVIFTSGSTDALNLVASSFASPMIEPGDEIVLSVMEHHRSEEHTSEPQSLMCKSYAVFCLKKKISKANDTYNN